jgi:hypothetical protein
VALPYHDALGEVREQLTVQTIQEAKRVAFGCQAEFGGEGGDGIIGLDALQVGPRTDNVVLMVDGQDRRFRCQNELEGITSQGFDLHGHLDIEVVRFLLKPDLGHPVSLEIEMFIAPYRHRGDIELMSDDSLRPIVARVKPQPLRAEPHRLRIAIVGVVSDCEVHVSEPTQFLFVVFSMQPGWSRRR